MSRLALKRLALGGLAGLLLSLPVRAQHVKTVFVIAIENHNWTQPVAVAGRPQAIKGNPNAPFVNSLVNATASATINGSTVQISRQVAYASSYHNVLATASGSNPHIHPSEPNYIWSEAGTNFGVANDNDPYSPKGPTNQQTPLHLCALLTKAGKNWRSYQEDIDLTPNANAQLTSVPLPASEWTVPLESFSGTFAEGYTNAYNGSNRYNYATKHNPMAFFTDTNGDDITTLSNPLAAHYAPLQQLAVDLKNNRVAGYNWITPDQFNDMHSALPGGYKGLAGDDAAVRQGDDFLSQIVPLIMGSEAYKNDGAIIIWCDETEAGAPGDNPDAFDHTLTEIVISPLAHANVDGRPYLDNQNLSHSSDLRTMQEIFQVGPWLADAASAADLSDLFKPGAIPHLSEPAVSGRQRALHPNLAKPPH